MRYCFKQSIQFLCSQLNRTGNSVLLFHEKHILHININWSCLLLELDSLPAVLLLAFTVEDFDVEVFDVEVFVVEEAFIVEEEDFSHDFTLFMLTVSMLSLLLCLLFDLFDERNILRILKLLFLRVNDAGLVCPENVLVEAMFSEYYFFNFVRSYFLTSNNQKPRYINLL